MPEIKRHWLKYFKNNPHCQLVFPQGPAENDVEVGKARFEAYSVWNYLSPEYNLSQFL